MKISLEEAFKILTEDQITPEEVSGDDIQINAENEENPAQNQPTIDKDLDNEFKTLDKKIKTLRTKLNRIKKAKKDIQLGKKIKKIKDKVFEDLWDQVYCSLTDSVDNRVYNLLGEWSGNKHYSISHVTPSVMATDKLPRDFKPKAGYDDIIVFSPSVDIEAPLVDDEDENIDSEEMTDVDEIFIGEASRRGKNKSNRGEDFSYAREVAEIYNLPYQEFDDAFVLYIPKSKYLKAEPLDLTKIMTLFPEDLIDDYLNNTNQRITIDGKKYFTYNLKPYFKNRSAYDKNKNMNYALNDQDVLNWVDDTTDQIFYDTFGVKKADNDYSEKEQQIFDLLHKKTLDRAIIVADNAVTAYKNKDKDAQILPQLLEEEEDLINEINDWNSEIDTIIETETDPVKKENMTKYKIDYEPFSFEE